MPETHPTEHRWSLKSFRSGQDPNERLWAAIYALIILIVVVGVTTVAYARSTQRDIEENIDLGWHRGTVNCLLVIVDNDRKFQLPDYCEQTEIIVHYPPEICTAYFQRSAECGEKWEGE